MGRYSANTSYSHGCSRIDYDCYSISWVTDRYYASSRLRFPRTTRRVTDEVGARKFCKKWGVEFPIKK